jgi:hypothetical protein
MASVLVFDAFGTLIQKAQRRVSPYARLITADSSVNQRRILLSRSPAQLSVNWLELGGQPRKPSADKSYAQLCASI